MSERELEALLEQILSGGRHFLAGVNGPSSAPTDLLTGVVNWGQHLGRSLGEISAGIEPMLRQSILFSLLPARAFDDADPGVSLDAAIAEHLAAIRVSVSEDGRRRIRDVCINIRRMRALSADAARAASATLATVRARPSVYNRLLEEQANRCIWCGVDFAAPGVVQTLEHVAPKHIGDDPADGSNWALACATCNSGKGDALAWAASPFAHDYVPRKIDPSLLSKEHRWAILMRSKKCDRCGVGTNAAELHVYKRITTGLPVPAHCSLSCASCALARGLTLLRVDWDVKERMRAQGCA